MTKSKILENNNNSLYVMIWYMFQIFKFVTLKKRFYSFGPEIEYCGYVWTQSSLSSRVQNRLRSLIEKLFIFHPATSFHTDATLQAYRYFNGKCSNQLRSLVPPVISMTRHSTCTVSNLPLYSIHKKESPLRQLISKYNPCRRTCSNAS